MSRWLIPVVLSMLLSGCAAWTLVEGERRSVAGHYTVAPQISWSRLRQGNVEVWTVDGPALQAIRFFDGLADGDELFPSPAAEKLPAYSSSMTPTEIEEFVVHSAQRAGAARVDASNLRPWRFGGRDGFRFDLAFVDAGGLEMNGLVAGVVDGGKLYLIVYSGARAHYYPKYVQQVERVLGSIEIKA
jgi:hypothetical protein